MKTSLISQVPLLGSYGDTYQWLENTYIIKPSLDKKVVTSFPSKVQKILELNNAMKKDFFMLNFNASTMSTKNFNSYDSWRTRLNLVLHPLIFPDAHAGGEYKNDVYSTLIRINESDPIYPTHDTSGIQFDQINILEDTCKHLVHLHDREGEPALSPNNASFVVNLAYPVVMFYIVTVVPYGFDKRDWRVIVTLCTILNDDQHEIGRDLDMAINKVKLLTHTPPRSFKFAKGKDDDLLKVCLMLLEKKVKKVCSYVEKVTKKYLNILEPLMDQESYKTTLSQMFLEVFTEYNVSKEEDDASIKAAQELTTYFYEMVWRYYHRPNVKDFGEERFYSSSNATRQLLLENFFGALIKRLESVGTIHQRILYKYKPEEKSSGVKQESGRNVSQFSGRNLGSSALLQGFGFSRSTAATSEGSKGDLHSSENRGPSSEKPRVMVNNSEVHDDEGMEEHKDDIEFDYEVVDYCSLIQTKEADEDEANHMEETINAFLSDGPERGYQAFNGLTTNTKNYIYEETWKFKGSLNGISDEFGRYSFHKSPKLPDTYHCSSDEIIQILTIVQEKCLKFGD